MKLRLLMGVARGAHMEPRRYGSIGVWLGCIATINFLAVVRRIDSLHLIGSYTDYVHLGVGYINT